MTVMGADDSILQGAARCSAPDGVLGAVHGYALNPRLGVQHVSWARGGCQGQRVLEVLGELEPYTGQLQPARGNSQREQPLGVQGCG
jgi:hypothetical protein